MSHPDLVYQDELTGAYNRRYLSQLFEQRWDELRSRKILSIIIVDLDQFKAINDAHGHATGDEALRTIASVLRDSFRKDDIVVRYGGDEFVVVLPGAAPEEATHIAERARASAALRPLTSPGGRPAGDSVVSFSVGIASYPRDGATGEVVLEAADRRLYADKRRRQRRDTARRHAVSGVVVAAIVVALSLLALNMPRPAQHHVDAPPTPSPTATVSDIELELAEARIRELQLQIDELTEKLQRQEDNEERGLYVKQIEHLGRQVAELSRPLPSPMATPSASPVATPADVVEGATPVAAATAEPTVVTTPADSPGGESTHVPSDDSMIPEPKIELSGARQGPDPPGVTPPVIVLPIPRQRVVPDYPAIARRQRRQAVVRLGVVVDVEGRVRDAVPYGESVGYGFEREAIAAVRRTRFSPGLKDTVATEMEIIMTFSFVLDAGD